MPLRPGFAADQVRSCSTCGAEISPADQVWYCPLAHHPRMPLCWHCGVSILLARGCLSPSYLDWPTPWNSPDPHQTPLDQVNG